MWRERPFWQDILKEIIEWRTLELREEIPKPRPETRRALRSLLAHPFFSPHARTVEAALWDPYFPLGMIRRTILADVTGMRFFINKTRPDIQEALSLQVAAAADLFLEAKRDLVRVADPKTVTCVPLDGRLHPLPSGGWCRLCGTCCQIGGVQAEPPPGVGYPPRWVAMIEGSAHPHQQLCPFLFQYFGRDIYFCAIHRIKPRACAGFGPEDCARCRTDIALHERDP
ncbi:hypothetical protein [Desulfacinum infernum]|nr:hypothetical protein [Desulfacinum infernum]